MRKTALILITFFLLSSKSAYARVSFGAGASLWAYDTDYIMQINPELNMDFNVGKSQINIDLILPIFMGLNYSSPNLQTAAETLNNTFYGFGFYINGFSQGMWLNFAGPAQGIIISDFNEERWPELLSDPLYLITYIKNLSFKLENFSASYFSEMLNSDVEIEKILWYNPFFDRKTGIVNRYLEINFFQGTLQTSSLTDPGFFSLDYVLKPFSESKASLLRDASITPLAWIDFRNQAGVDGGAGAGISSGAGGPDKFKIRFLSDVHFFSSHFLTNETFSYRINAGASFLFEPIGFSLMYINKSPHQPYGPFLSPLYLSRSESNYAAYSKNHGIDFGIIPGFGSKLNASLNAEIYPESTFNFSIRGQIRYQWEKNYLGIAYIHENMTDIGELISFDNSETFLELQLKVYIVPEVFVLELRNMFNFSETSSIKSFLSLMAYF